VARERPLDARFSNGDGSLRLRFLHWRNRLIGSPPFQAWAARNPFTRPVARHHARELFDLTAGFVYSQVAAALVESGLLDALAAESLTFEEAATRAALPPEASHTLLKAAASLRLTEQAGDRWCLGIRGAALAATPGLADMIRHHRLLYADLADPLAMLRGGGEDRLAALWRYDRSADPAAVSAYSRLMAATQPMIAAQAIAAYAFRRHRRLLDIGGGEGAFLAAVGEGAPALQLGLCDLPAVAARAVERQPQLAGRLALHPGSFLADPLPPGYDLHSLVRVLHDHDDAPAFRILAASRAALEPGGRLLIVEPMAKAGAAPEGHAYFGFYLAAMRSGRPREASEIKDMLRRAGFRRARELRTPLPMAARAIIANA
jgi:demethylspheroidene O-methyltransferase